MGKEIERKFLVRSDAWKSLGKSTLYRQGYLSTHVDRAVRVRIIGDRAWMTIKSRQKGLMRLEFEYEVPLADAATILDEICERPIIEKTRHTIKFDGMIWEVDDFHGENRGLVVAEVELEEEDQQITLPPWVGEEVSHDPRYLNTNLTINPYTRWEKS